MKTEQCNECGKKAEITTGNYRFDEIGLRVVLKNVELVQCKECGSVEPVIPNLNGLMHAIAWAVISHSRSLSGDEIKFLRKYLGTGTEEFSQLMHVDKATLSRWENGAEPGAQSDRLIRLLVLNKSQELREHIETMMKVLPQIAEPSKERRRDLKIDPRTLEYEYA